MGLLDGIKKFIDNSEASGNQTADDTKKSIISLKQNSQLNRNPLLLKLLDECGNLEEIHVGTGNYTKEELFSKFHIDDQKEEVIFYLCGKLGLLGKMEPRFLTTNAAVYFIKANNSGSKKYTFLDLTKYIFLSSENDGKIQLVNEKENNTVYEKGIVKKHLSQNGDIFTLTKVITTIQIEMIAESSSAKENRNILFKWLYEKINESLKSVGLYPFDESLVKTLRKEKYLKVSCNLLLLKAYLYTQDLASFFFVLGEMEILPEDEQEVSKKFENIFLTYIDELKNFSVSFSERCLGDIGMFGNDTVIDSLVEITFGQIETSPTFQKNIIDMYRKNSQDIDYYNAIRKNMQIPVEIIVKLCSAKEISFPKEMEYVAVCLYQHNKSMNAVFNKIKSGGLPDIEQLEWCDGQGLTALHYAMILKNTDAIEFSIKHMQTREPILNEERDELRDVQLYGVVALLTNMDEYFDALMDQTDEILPLLKTKKELYRKKTALDIFYKATSLTASLAEKQLRQAAKGKLISQEQIEHQTENINGALSHLDATQENIQDLEDQIETLENDIYSIKLQLRKHCEEITKYIKSTSNSFGKYFYFIYSDAELLEKILKCVPDNLKICKHNEKFIFIDSSIGDFEFEKGYSSNSSNTNNYKDRKTSHSNNNKRIHDEFQKPYGDSWFSAGAHKNMKKLTKEYYKLATKYHPDNNPDMLAAFLSIQDERAEILENLEYEE